MRSSLPVNENSIVNYEFIAKENKIQSVTLRFKNEKYYNTKGTIEVALMDSSGNTIAESSLKSSIIRNKIDTVFSFVVDNEVLNSTKYTNHQNVIVPAKEGVGTTRGEKYSIVIRSEGVTQSDNCELLTSSQKKNDTSVLSVDGEVINGSVPSGSIQFSTFSSKVLLFFLLLILGTFLIVFMPWRRVESQIVKVNTESSDGSFPQKVLLRLLAALIPFILFWILFKIQGLALSQIISNLNSQRLYSLLNFTVVLIVLTVLYLLTNRIKATIIISTAIFYMFSVACYVLIQFRDIPLRATDFSDIGTAADVASNYELLIDKAFLWITIVSICVIVLAL